MMGHGFFPNDFKAESGGQGTEIETELALLLQLAVKKNPVSREGFQQRDTPRADIGLYRPNKEIAASEKEADMINVRAFENTNVQIFETTVADRQSGYIFRFLSIPTRSMPIEAEYSRLLPGFLEGALKLESLQSVRASALPSIIMAMVQADEAKDSGGFQAQAAFTQFLNPVSPSQKLLAFAEEVAFAEIIPFQESPVSLVSLAGKVASYERTMQMGYGFLQTGAFIGVLAGGMSSLLLVTVPTGIILCGAAYAFAKIVDERRDDILNAIYKRNI